MKPTVSRIAKSERNNISEAPISEKKHKAILRCWETNKEKKIEEEVKLDRVNVPNKSFSKQIIKLFSENQNQPEKYNRFVARKMPNFQ